MKEGWTYKKFGEVCSYHKEQGSFQNLPYVGMEHMESCTGKLLGTISSNSVLSSSFKFNKGEILYGRLRPYLKKVYVAEFDGCCSTEVFPINSDSIEPGFIKYWFLSDKITNMVNKTSAGCRMPRGNMNEVKNFLIGFPEDRKEQKRIVKRLDAAFENIDKLKANAEKQLAEAQTLFQKSLAKAMEPKEGWEEKTMSEITEVKDGTHDSPKYVTEGIPFVTQKNITINGFDLINTKKITLEDHKKFYTRSNVEFGDIIIAMIGANRGMSCIVNTREIFSIKNVGLIKKTDNINMRFLLYYLHSPAANSYVLENSNGGAQEFIGLKGLRNFPIQFPPLAEQQRIVERLDALSENIRKYEEIQRQIISECDALKQALLRKVFE